MTKRFARAFWLFLPASTAAGGTVSFSPGHLTIQPGDTAVFQVGIGQTDLAFFDSVYMVIDFNPFIAARDFDYAPSFVARTTLPPFTPWSFCEMYSCLAPGGNDFNAPFFSAPLLVGTLTLETNGLAPGTYEVMVSAEHEIELIGSPLSVVAFGPILQEPLEGRATFTVVPERATIAMLLVGAMLLRRRGTRAHF